MVGSVVVSSGTGVPDLQEFSVDDAILIRGARVHNLRNVDVAIPRDKLVVITGVSGSGKSSLAFDTLFASAFRRRRGSMWISLSGRTWI
jgi:excinuclease UvrABC ATPase subunit